MADIKVIIDGQVAELPPNGLNLPLTYPLRSRDGLSDACADLFPAEVVDEQDGQVPFVGIG